MRITSQSPSPATILRAAMEGREVATRVDKPRRSEAAQYVSAATLAARLDCSTTTVHGYVRRGILPKPRRIGELVRWKWTEVTQRIESLEAGDDSHADANDPYLEGLERGTTEEAGH